MNNFFFELKRRHIYRVAAVYTVVAWGLLQVVNNVAPVLDLPAWIARAILLVLIVGFPVALIFAWIYELKPAAASSLPPPEQAGTSDGPTSGIGKVLPRRPVTVRGAPARESSTTRSESSRERPLAISIAVLPFANMSGDLAQEFFSDGITEEITAALAKVTDLRVVARTSAFEFKGRNHNIRTIGEALGASHLIEGSVRKAGERVRITAQLIIAQDGTHLWSESYDRNLTDVFAVQEGIAQAIAGALRVPLGLKQGEALVPGRTGDVESYQQYLRARALVRTRGSSVKQAIAILEPLVARNPGFAPAWSLLAHAYYLLPTYDPVARTASLAEARQHVRSYYEKGDVAARQSMKLDSRSADGYVALGAIQTQRGKWVEAENLLREALALDPTEPDALYNLSIALTSMGRFKDAMAVGEKLQTLEPFVPNYNITVAGHMLIGGEIQGAISILESIPPEAAGGYYRAITLAHAYAAQARFAHATDALLAMPQPNVVSRHSVEEAARLIRLAPAKVDSPEKLPVLEGGLNFVYGYVGAPDRVMEFPERVRDVTGGGTIPFIWSPGYAPVRNTERFKAHLRAVGLVDYWRTRGWPDICRPVGPDDFVCD